MRADPLEAAGLTNGRLYALRADNFATEALGDVTYGVTNASLIDLGAAADFETVDQVCLPPLPAVGGI